MSVSRLFGAIIRHPRIVLAVALLLAAFSIVTPPKS